MTPRPLSRSPQARAEARAWRWIAEWVRRAPSRKYWDFGEAIIDLADIEPAAIDEAMVMALWERMRYHGYSHKILKPAAERYMAALLLALECEDDARSARTRRAT